MTPTDAEVEAVALAIAQEVIAAWRRTDDGSIMTGDDMRNAARAAIMRLDEVRGK